MGFSAYTGAGTNSKANRNHKTQWFRGRAGPFLLRFILPMVSFCSHRCGKCVPSVSGRSRGVEGLFLEKDDRERVHLMWREPLV